MRILVTGANGQLGREMQRVALGALAGHQLYFTDVEELNITDATAVSSYVEEYAIEGIVNCAAYTNVDRAEEDAESARLINATAVGYLASAAKKHNALLIHVSTDYVFGGRGNVPYTEEDSSNPLGVYGRTKLEGEQAIVSLECRAIILRTAWLYSVHGHNFVKTMRRLMRERERVDVVFDQVGSPTYAGDLAEAIARIILAQPSAGQLGVYHYTNEGVCSWYDFAEAIRVLSGLDCDVRPCHSSEFPSRVRRPAFSVLDKSKIRRVFGITPPHWQRSLAACIAALQAVERSEA